MLLDLVLGYDCNLSCSYCTLSPASLPAERRARRLSSVDAVRAIDRGAALGYRDLAFTGGEPTLRDDLPGLVRHGKRRGFEHVKVASNGLRYAHAPYLDALVRAGVDRFHVSMHAFRDEDYDRVVRRPGAAALRRQALEHLLARGLDPVADLVVKSDTFREVPAWIASLHAAGVRRFALWLVSLTDANAANVEQLPRLSDVVAPLREAFDEARRGGYEVVSLHTPRCFFPEHVDHVRHPAAEGVHVVTPEESFDLARSRLSGGVLPAGCGGCRYAGACPGLRADYVARWGDGEVKAVRAAEEPRA